MTSQCGVCLLTCVHIIQAATPSCSSQLPAYLQHADAFKAKGVSSISCVTINDFFCVKAWADGMLAKNPVAADSVAVKFYGDDTGALLSSMNLTFDATPLLGNHRAQRAAIVVKDGVITAVHVESDPSAVYVFSSSYFFAGILSCELTSLDSPLNVGIVPSHPPSRSLLLFKRVHLLI